MFCQKKIKKTAVYCTCLGKPKKTFLILSHHLKSNHGLEVFSFSEISDDLAFKVSLEPRILQGHHLYFHTD